MQPRKRTNTILGGILFLIVGIGLLSGALVTFRNEQRFIGTATHVTGSVTRLRISTDSHDDLSYAPVVQFTTIDNQNISYASDTYSNPSSFSVGSKVEIYYDPANPQRVVIGGQNQPLYLILGGLGIVFTLLGIGTLLVRAIRG